MPHNAFLTRVEANRKSLKQKLKVIEAEVLPILREGSHFAKIEAARILAALSGVYVGSAMRSVDPPQAEYQLRMAQETLAGKVFQRAAARKRANRRYYLRQRIKELKQSGPEPELLASLEAELQAMVRAIRMPRNRAESPADASEASGAGKSTLKTPELTPEAREAQSLRIAEAVANAKRYLAQYNGEPEDE